MKPLSRRACQISVLLLGTAASGSLAALSQGQVSQGDLRLYAHFMRGTAGGVTLIALDLTETSGEALPAHFRAAFRAGSMKLAPRSITYFTRPAANNAACKITADDHHV